MPYITPRYDDMFLGYEYEQWSSTHPPFGQGWRKVIFSNSLFEQSDLFRCYFQRGYLRTRCLTIDQLYYDEWFVIDDTAFSGKLQISKGPFFGEFIVDGYNLTLYNIQYPSFERIVYFEGICYDINTLRKLFNFHYFAAQNKRLSNTLTNFKFLK